MKETETMSTKFAAALVGVTGTYFRKLASDPEPIEPLRLKGSAILVWTPAQVEAVGERVKRRAGK